MSVMRVRDLGVNNEPIVLFGGPYSNAQATEALIEAAAGRQMICTGDTVAYCGAPERTVALIREVGCHVVAGNCEVQLGEDAADCGCGFEEGSACDLLSVGWYGFARQQVSDADKAWMRELPQILSFEHNGARYAVIHGGMSDVARFIWPVSNDDVFAEEWALVEDAIGPVDHVVAGHCGIPFVKETPKGRWINAGVIGMPPHDGGTQTRYAVLHEGDVRIETLSYDVEGAAADMARAGLPDGYRKGLLTGYWPSEDVLPPELRVPSLASG